MGLHPERQNTAFLFGSLARHAFGPHTPCLLTRAIPAEVLKTCQKSFLASLRSSIHSVSPWPHPKGHYPLLGWSRLSVKRIRLTRVGFLSDCLRDLINADANMMQGGKTPV